MAYVCKQEFGKRNRAGNGMRFTTKVYALANGEFVFYDIPDDILRMLGSTKANLQHNNSRSKVGLHVDKMRDGRITIGAAIDALLTEKVTEELVLRYHYSATCHYFVTNDGTIHANGTEFTGSQGQWEDTIIKGKEEEASWSSCGNWVIGFQAEVEKKVTYKSGEKVKVEYARPTEEELGEWGNMLNGFVHTSMSGSPKELPYTEDVAKLFYDSMLKLCNLARALTEFLSEPKNVLEGIGMPLLTGEEGPKKR